MTLKRHEREVYMIEEKVKELKKKYTKIKVIIYKDMDKVPYSKYKYSGYHSVFIDKEIFPVKVIFEI